MTDALVFPLELNTTARLASSATTDTMRTKRSRHTSCLALAIRREFKSFDFATWSPACAARDKDKAVEENGLSSPPAPLSNEAETEYMLSVLSLLALLMVC